jgi:hypothetical protein
MKKIFKLIGLVLILCSLLSILITANATATSGKCGEKATWNFDSGTLTISGEGEVTKSADWKNYKNTVFTIIVEEGIGKILSGVFSDFTAVTKVYLPKSIYNFRTDAFTNTGNIKFYCFKDSTVAKIIADEKLNLHIHSFDYANPKVFNPTCTEDGYNSFVCNAGDNCQYIEIKITSESLGHALLDANGMEVPYGQGQTTKQPTCTEKGKIEWVCGRCGKELAPPVEIPALGHDWEEKIEEEPTCERMGKKTRTCKRCKLKDPDFVQAIPKLKHNWVEKIKLAPTCTADGLKEKYCTSCKNTIEEIIPATGHSAGEIKEIIAPTCENPGLSSYICLNCGKEITFETAPSGHNEGKKTTTVKPTCTETGTWIIPCTRCEKVLDSGSIDALGHKFSNLWTYEMINNNCQNGGIRYHKCERCDERIDEEKVDKTEHVYSEGYVPIIPATCLKGGTEGICCIRCGVYTTSRPTEALGHDFGDTFETDVEPTCTEKGRMSIHCSRCDATSTEKEIRALGHDYVLTEIITDSTCSQFGVGTKTCTRCKDVKPAQVEKKAHTSDAPGILVEPTCTSFGAIYYQCAVCGEVYITDRKEALGHRWDKEKTLEIPATCTHDGSRSRTCADCGYIDNEVLKAKGHYFSDWMLAESSTLLIAGYEIRTCRTCQGTERRDLPKLAGKVLKDEATGIVVSYQSDLHKGEMTLVIKDVLDEKDKYSKVQINGVTKLWQITLLEDGKPIADDELYLVSVPKGEIAGGLLQVYMVDSLGYPRSVEYTLQFDEVVFETTIKGCVALASALPDEATKGFIKGDVNFDGSVKATDARLALRIALGLEETNPAILEVGDLDGDGKITTQEARKILRVALGLDTFEGDNEE